MEIIILSTAGILIIIIGLVFFIKRIKTPDNQLEPLIESSTEIDSPFNDYMCIMLTDGSTIISGKTSNGEKYSVKGNARRPAN
jgi:hypothetical protein